MWIHLMLWLKKVFIWSILIRKKQKNQGKYGLIMQFSMKKRIPMRQKEMCGY